MPRFGTTECHSKSAGGDSDKISSLEMANGNLRKGLTATMNRLDQFLSHQKKGHAQLGELHRKVDFMRDELTAWEVYFQQQPPEGSGIPEKQVIEVQAPTTVITTMAHQGDTKIEVSDPDSFPVGKYIVIQESLIYMVMGKGSLILDRPLSRDFLTGTTVRLLTDTDQKRVESNDIYLQNPQTTHSYNGECGISPMPHGGNGNQGTSPHIEQMGLDINSHSGNGGSLESDPATTPLPCG